MSRLWLRSLIKFKLHLCFDAEVTVFQDSGFCFLYYLPISLQLMDANPSAVQLTDCFAAYCKINFISVEQLEIILQLKKKKLMKMRLLLLSKKPDFYLCRSLWKKENTIEAEVLNSWINQGKGIQLSIGLSKKLLNI